MLSDNGRQFLGMNAERFQMAKHALDIWAGFAAKYFPSGFPPDTAMKGPTHTNPPVTDFIQPLSLVGVLSE